MANLQSILGRPLSHTVPSALSVLMFTSIWLVLDFGVMQTPGEVLLGQSFCAWPLPS